MTPEQVTQQTILLVGVPYRNEPPFNIETGFNCLYWADYIYKLADKDVELNSSLKNLVRNFRKVLLDEPFQYLDIASFSAEVLGKRHIGVMINGRIMSHCSEGTNGVALSDITRQPWVTTFKGFYRLK